ncbi:hypothetical protein FNV43_RR21641 [Rhamnella rubrinervis]|uniref:Uncharacterized protein n=1 Tax=Rhamnella rubrinervis TaxID=2594499 RepID=A0A8K0DQ29_9ROSA|nr:hypothetical protein FNV43_RR21641 [Rhamnella rubrinervis]
MVRARRQRLQSFPTPHSASQQEPIEVSSGSPSFVASPILGHGNPTLDPIPLAVRSPSSTQGDRSDAGVKVTLPPVVSRGSGSRSTRVGAPSSAPVAPSKRRRLILDAGSEEKEDEEDLDPLRPIQG